MKFVFSPWVEDIKLRSYEGIIYIRFYEGTKGIESNRIGGIDHDLWQGVTIYRGTVCLYSEWIIVKRGTTCGLRIVPIIGIAALLCKEIGRVQQATKYEDNEYVTCFFQHCKGFILLKDNKASW